MKIHQYILVVLLAATTPLFSKAILNNNYGTMSEITFQLYDENVPSYAIPENLKSTEEVLMYEILHAVWVNNKWIAYTLNKNLVGTFKVGSPAMSDNNGVKRIFFVANFPGTRGGMDIYSAEFKNGAWSKPKNLGDVVNTVHNEANPGLLTENILTFSSNGIIKKYDLGTMAIEELSTKTEPVKTTTTTTTTTIEPEQEKPVVQETSTTVTETIISPVETPAVEETKPVVTSSTVPVSAPSVFTALGKKATDAMKSTYKNSIQLGVFGNPNWSQLEQFSRFGKLVTFKNEKDLNPVWVTGFKTLTEAENILQEIRMVPGFEKAYVLK